VQKAGLTAKDDLRGHFHAKREFRGGKKKTRIKGRQSGLRPNKPQGVDAFKETSTVRPDIRKAWFLGRRL